MLFLRIIKENNRIKRKIITSVGHIRYDLQEARFHYYSNLNERIFKLTSRPENVLNK